MSESYFFTNSALVESGDFFKIMETRYPHSLFDREPCAGYSERVAAVGAGFELIRRKHHGCTYGSIFSDESNYYCQRCNEVHQHLSVKIYELINKESKYYDPTFPLPIRLSESRIGWSAWEVHQWIETKLESREE